MPDASYKQLMYRSLYRGNREMDNILGHFARARLAEMPQAERATYAALLDENDHDLWGWLTGQLVTPPEYSALLDELRSFQQSRFGA